MSLSLSLSLGLGGKQFGEAVVVVPMVADQQLLYNSLNMTDFNTLSGISISASKLLVESNPSYANIGADNSITLNTVDVVAAGDIVNVDGLDHVINTFEDSTGFPDDTLGDGSTMNVFDFNNDLVDSLSNATSVNVNGIYSFEGDNTLVMMDATTGLQIQTNSPRTLKSATMEMYHSNFDTALGYLIDAQPINGGYLYIDNNSGLLTRGGMNIWVNGELNPTTMPYDEWFTFEYESTTVTNLGTALIHIGGSSHSFPCKIRNLRVYDRVLTEEERVTIRGGGIGTKVLSTTPSLPVSPSTAIYQHNKAKTNPIIQDGVDTDFIGIKSLATKLEYQNLAIGATEDKIICSSKVRDGEKFYVSDGVNSGVVSALNALEASTIIADGSLNTSVVTSITTAGDYTTLEGQVIYSGEYNGSYVAWMALDGSEQSTWIGQSGVINGSFIGFLYASPTVINKYAMMRSSATTPTAMAKDWIFQGSNDTTNGSDGTWTDLDTVSEITDWTDLQEKWFSFINEIPYKGYRLYILANQGYTTYTGISYIKMVEAEGGTGHEVDTSNVTLGNIPILAYSMSEKLSFDFGNGYVSATGRSDVITSQDFVPVSNPILITASYADLTDAVGGRTLNTLVEMKQSGDMLSEITGEIQKKVS